MGVYDAAPTTSGMTDQIVKYFADYIKTNPEYSRILGVGGVQVMGHSLEQ